MGKSDREERDRKKAEARLESAGTRTDLVGFTIEGITVGSWIPNQKARGPATAVALELVLKGQPNGYCRLKSAEAVNGLILALARHRDDVFPGQSIGVRV